MLARRILRARKYIVLNDIDQEKPSNYNPQLKYPTLHYPTGSHMPLWRIARDLRYPGKWVKWGKVP